MISLEGEEATHKSELTVNRSRKNLSESSLFTLFRLLLATHRIRTRDLRQGTPMLNHRAMRFTKLKTVTLCLLEAKYGHL
ncbi:hypothetical protein OUZ56_023007 [Daphnia magna]|uniref:Uncharacterized protein n=1 Tax=Daphnia magna TaxID=35525 RepID=A0ABR0AY62_9CRUS|nr:hypothetical protein OUZ56_023007 [Daphnia magna]